jgi:hypothetical protein
MGPRMTPLFSLDACRVPQTNEHAHKRSVEECLDTISFALSPSSAKRVHSSPVKNATLVELFHHPYVVASTISLICHVADHGTAIDQVVRLCYEQTREYLTALAPSRISGSGIRAVLRMLYTPTNTIVPLILQAAIGDLFVPFAFEPSSIEPIEGLPLDKAVGMLVHDTLYKPEKRAFCIEWFQPHTEICIDVPAWPFVMKRSNTMKSGYIGYWSSNSDASVSFVLIYHPHADDISIVEASDESTGVSYVRIPRRRFHSILPGLFPTAYALEV